MRVAGTELNLRHKAIEIYLSGCRPPHCVGCHNQELWDFEVGALWAHYETRLEQKVTEARKSGLVEYAWILGGEPLDQDKKELCELLKLVKSCDVKIVLWTHYESIPDEVKKLCHYAKLGPYNRNGKPYIEDELGIKLANREQRIVRLPCN